jgi:hypothetical protein
MSINWSVLKREHVQRACELVASSTHSARGRGLFVIYRGGQLPAKEVARVAYLLATSQPVETRLRFASGESTITLLRNLGCQVERAPAPPKAGSGASRNT